MKPISPEDAKRYQDTLQVYLSRKRDMKLAGTALMDILIKEFGVPAQRAVRMEPSSFIAGILAASGVRTPDLDEAQ